MSDVTGVSREKAMLYEQRAKKVIESLQKRGMIGQYAPDSQAALSAVMDMIPAGVVVARGDSMSVDQVGVIPEIIKRNQNKMIDPFSLEWGKEEERYQMERETFFADILVVSTNAITLDGKLVNIDGNGNRVAAMTYGPKKVICVVGINKIVQDVNEALDRIHQFAAPVNARRFILNNRNPKMADLPCIRTGSCIDCSHELRICNYTVIIEGAMPQHKGRINVVIVGEELGI
ncbi:lactate utilization protein [Chloroflexota bacterium]